MTMKYFMDTRVIVKNGKFLGQKGVIVDFRAGNSGFPGDRTIWAYAVHLDSGRTKWLVERDIAEIIDN